MKKVKFITSTLLFVVCTYMFTGCSYYYWIYPSYYKKIIDENYLLHLEDMKPVYLTIELTDTIYKPNCNVRVKIILENKSMDTIKIFEYRKFCKPYFFYDNKLVEIQKTASYLHPIYSCNDSVPILIGPTEKYEYSISLDELFGYNFYKTEQFKNKYKEVYSRDYEYNYFKYPIGQYELYIYFSGYGYPKISNIVRFSKKE